MSFPYKLYLAPKYWGLWFAFGVLKAFTYLPVRWSLYLGSGIGWLLYKLASSRRRVAYINIQQAYPNYSKEQVEALNLACFRSLGMSIFETGYAWYSKKKYLKSICDVEGSEHLDNAMKKGKGVILLTGHFTTVDTGAHMIGFYSSPYAGVYKKAHNPLFNEMMAHSRAGYGTAIANINVRHFVRCLKEGYSCWYAPDQDFSSQDIVFKPFLGGMATTLTSTVKMAKMTGATIVPFYPLRMRDKNTSTTGNKKHMYKMVILPALENFPSGSIEDDCERINQSIESMVYANPEQYGWMHKRFKTTPDRKNDFYSRDH